MKYFVVVIMLLLLISCKEDKKQAGAVEVAYERSVSKSIKKRVFPLKNVAKVELLSYFDRTLWDTIEVKGEDYMYKTLVADGKFLFDSTFIKEKIALNDKQKKELFALMVCDTCAPEELGNACYMPRHMIVFRNAKNKIIAYNEFCFHCIGSRYSKNLEHFQQFCLIDMHDLFKKYGISYLDDTKEQQKEENRFIDSILKAKGIRK